MTIRSLQEPIEALMEGRFCSQAVHGLQAGTRQDTKHTNTQIQIHKCKNINTYAGITYIPRCDPKGLGNSVLAKCSLDAWLWCSGCLAGWPSGHRLCGCYANGLHLSRDSSCMAHWQAARTPALVQHFHIEQQAGEELTVAHTGVCDYRAAPLWAEL